jgi:hypothetical protein
MLFMTEWPMNRLWAALLIVLIQPVAGFSQDTTVGVWTGIGLQTTSDGRIVQWTIKMRIDSKDKGAIDYPSLNCGGTLTYLRSIGDIREYREQLIRGAERCTNNGTVGFHPRLGKLIWYWSGEGTANPTGIDIAVLNRAAN